MPRLKRPVKKSFFEKLVGLLGHRYFFVTVVVLFFAQMAWIALSSAYPMLFDEEYHLGIIDVYSHSISPFIAVQPPEAASHGDITRYSSYLFHYLMSFPYRFVQLFTHDIMMQVIVLRFVCIGLVLGGVVLFRKVLLKAGLSRATVHLALLCFTLIPLVPFALCQLNYDALLFVMVPAMFYFTLCAREQNKLQGTYAALLLVVGFFASITKFTALPILLGCIVFLTISLWRQYNRRLLSVLGQQYKQLPRIKLILITGLLLLGFGLVVERYGINIVTYHALEPKCDRLHNVDDCMEYTVYRRDASWRQKYQQQPYRLENPFEYTRDYWAPHIFNDFFVVGAVVDDDEKPISLRELPTTLQASAGNIILRTAGWVVFVCSIVLCIVALWRKPTRVGPLTPLLGLVFIIYATALFGRNYSDYLSIGTPTAAQGRYFIPLLIPVFGLAIALFARIVPKTPIRLGIMVLVLLCFSQGGGVANYILYSNPKWYWPEQRQTINLFNSAARHALRRVTPL